MELWSHQQYAVGEIEARRAKAKASGVPMRTALASPTGGGKSRIISWLTQKSVERQERVSIYVNRKQLVEQLLETLRAFDIHVGTMAAQYDRLHEDIGAPVQLCMSQTVGSRIATDRGDIPLSDLVVFDEAHLQKGGMASDIINRHIAQGADILGVTATPVGINEIYTDGLVIAGTNSQLRKSGVLMPCFVFAPSEFDLSKVKRQASGEYSAEEVGKKFYTTAVIGRLAEHLKLYNPDLRPTLVFAPGVEESLWLAKEYTKAGIRCAHIDGENCWIDDTYHASDPEARRQIIDECRSGRAVISNRFVMREGVDIPELYCLQLATPIGNTHSYVQICGRVLRSHASLKEIGHVILLDHGGSYHAHGSPNQDWDWESFWEINPKNISDIHKRSLQEGVEPQPIVCPKCSAARISGPTCWKCGFAHDRSCRMIIQETGVLKPAWGDVVKPYKREMRPNTEKLWASMVYASRQKKDSRMTFAQLEAFFLQKHGHMPPRGIPMMPTVPVDWYRKVRQVPLSSLSSRSNAKADYEVF